MAIALEITAQTPGMGAATADVDKLAKELAEASRGALSLAKSTDKSAKELQQYRKPAAQASKATNKTSKAMDKGAKSASKYTTALGSAKGALAGVVLGLSAKALVELGEAGGQIQAITRNLESLGFTADNTTDLMSRLGGGSVASIEQLISASDTAGLSFEQMQSAADAALSIAIQRGEDSHEVFQKLSKAIATGKVSYLKQVGINIDLKKTQADYAESLGKTVKELTATEKSAAISEAAISELNSAFGGQAPDKYASNIGAVRDAFDDLGDEIKRLAGNALSDLGAVIGWLRGGANGEIGFASDPVLKRSAQIQKSIDEMEEAVGRLESAASRGVSHVGDVVLDMQERMGGSAFTAMLGLPEETEITRLTAGYIDAQGKIQTQLATARKRLQAEIEKEEAEADIKAGIKADQEYEAAKAAAREKAREAARKAAEISSSVVDRHRSGGALRASQLPSSRPSTRRALSCHSTPKSSASRMTSASCASRLPSSASSASTISARSLRRISPSASNSPVIPRTKSA